jgi:hypothetical protein
MRFGMMYKQGDIVLIPVPFSDLSNRKQRPVLKMAQYGELSHFIFYGSSPYL